jgi:4-hydroxybenzoate polyprenyltransferase
VSAAAEGALAPWLRLVAFRHSVFALPFALQGAWLAARGAPRAGGLGGIVLCAVSARTAAMAFNRLVDARLDAANPRTRARELPAGRLRRGAVALLVAGASAVFVACAAALNPLCGRLAPAVLALLFFYSLTKRFTWTAHLFLGLCLGLAPPAAWLAVRGSVDGDVLQVLWLGAAVVFWVAGFDLIYACQDSEFDRSAGLHSVPARFGRAAALGAARACHALTVALLVAAWHSAALGWIYLGSIALAAGLLIWEHALVSARDLSRIDMAFFTLNGWIGVGLFAGLLLDLYAAGPATPWS